MKVLYLTARLDTDARRRVMETGQFLIDVVAVGGLDEHRQGSARHPARPAHARRGAPLDQGPQRADARDVASRLGHTINQEDLAGTLLTFSYVVADPMRRLGVHLSAKDVDAYLHLWNVIGHLLGVHDDVLAHDLADATALVDAIRRRQFQASPEGQDMTLALLNLLDELTPLHRFDDTIPPLIRHLIGDETADLLLVPESDLSDDLAPLARIANWFFVHVLGQVERDLPRYQLMSSMARPFGRELVRGIFALERGGERAPFDIPDHLARSWELSA